MEQADREYGIETVVVNDGAWDREFSDRSDIPARSHDGKIYIREGIPEEDAAEVVPHEATHIMRQVDFSPYREFLSTVPDRVNFASADSRFFLTRIFKHLTVEENGVLRQMEIDDIEADEVLAEHFYDEVNAAIYGYYANGIISGETDSGRLDLRNVMYDFDTYIQELSGIHQQFKNSRKGGTTMTEVANESEGSERTLHRDSDGKQGPSPESKENQVREVPAFHAPDPEMQPVSERDSEGDSGGREELRPVQGEVTPQRAIAQDVLKYVLTEKISKRL